MPGVVRQVDASPRGVLVRSLLGAKELRVDPSTVAEVEPATTQSLAFSDRVARNPAYTHPCTDNLTPVALFPVKCPRVIELPINRSMGEQGPHAQNSSPHGPWWKPYSSA